jgi:hypothetical protein
LLVSLEFMPALPVRDLVKGGEAKALPRRYETTFSTSIFNFYFQIVLLSRQTQSEASRYSHEGLPLSSLRNAHLQGKITWLTT